MAERRILAVAVAVWTLIAWGGRLMILDMTAGWDAIRVVGSLVVGGVSVAVLLIRRAGLRVVAYVFTGWTLGVWGRSVFNVWRDSNTLGFRLIHTLLAAGFAYLAWRLLSLARGKSVSGPDEGHGYEERHGESARLSQR